MNNQQKVYLPLISNFKNETQSLYKQLWKNKIADFSGLFIPHTFDNYCNSNKKCFYVGQDSLYWNSLEDVYNLSEEDYLTENNSFPASVEDIIERATNRYTFWHFVIRLHLTINNSNNDLSQLSDNDKSLLHQIGWGNLYSLEIPSTLKKYDKDFSEKYNVKFTDTYDKDVYKQLLDHSNKISRLKNIIDAYSPDYVFILAWHDIPDLYFSELPYYHSDIESIPKLVDVYGIENFKTKIIWTHHPQHLSRISQDPDVLISMIKDII